MAEYAALRGLVNAVVRDEKAPDLSMRQIGVLVAVAENAGKPLSVKPLAELMGLQKSAVTRALDRLEHFALASRRKHPMDARQIEVVVTKAGTDALKALTKALGKAA